MQSTMMMLRVSSSGLIPKYLVRQKIHTNHETGMKKEVEKMK